MVEADIAAIATQHLNAQLLACAPISAMALLPSVRCIMFGNAARHCFLHIHVCVRQTEGKC